MRKRMSQAEQQKRQREKEQAIRRRSLADALFNFGGFLLFLIVIAVLLASCVVPPAQPYTAADPGFAGMAAQATGTRASLDIAASRAAVEATAAALATAQSGEVTATAQSVEATAASMQATASVQAQQTAIVQATATQFQQNKEEIALQAEGTRQQAITEATSTAVYLAVADEIARSERSEWFWTAFLIILLLVLAGIGYGMTKLIVRNAMTVRDAGGEVIVYRNQFLLPADTLPAPAVNQDRFATHNNSQGAHGVNLYRQPKQLLDEQGSLIYEFSGRQLDALEINIMNGDLGFRRDKSSAGDGFDSLIGMKNRNLFSQILEEMKRRRYVTTDGSGNVWTRKGMSEFLAMQTLPYSTAQ